MRYHALFPAAALVALMPVAAHAQNNGAQAPEGATPPPEVLENIQRAFRVVKTFNAAFESTQPSEEVKGQLLLCLYEKGLKAIAAETGEVFANSPNLDIDDPTDFYRVSASVCGVVFRRNTPDERGPGSPDPETGR